jgi:hypothetical protein
MLRIEKNKLVTLTQIPFMSQCMQRLSAGLNRVRGMRHNGSMPGYTSARIPLRQLPRQKDFTINEFAGL